MKNKGFTLIELLAVIVILAIIALIATPIILNIINDSRDSANLRGAELYLKGAELGIARQNLTDELNNVECTVQSNGYLLCGSTTVKVEVDNPATAGTITVQNGKITDVSGLTLGGKTYSYDSNNRLVESESSPEEVSLEPGLYDEDDNLIASWDTLVNQYGLDVERDYTAGDYWTSSAITPANVFANENLQEGRKLIIPKGVQKIGNSAFYDLGRNNFLTDIIFENGSNLKIIGNQAFEYQKMESINLPNSLENIGPKAFDDCDSLQSIIIPLNVATIGGTAFNIGSLTTVIFENKDGWVASKNGNSVNISAEDLSDPELSATYLKNTYTFYTWTRTTE